MYDIQYYITLLKNNDIKKIEKLLLNGLDMIINKLNIIDILLLTDDKTIIKVYNNIKKNLLLKFFYIPETKYNPFINLINFGYYKNIVTLINLLSNDLDDNHMINILQYSQNDNNYWIIYFINDCDYIETYIYNFFKKYHKQLMTMNDNKFNYYFNYNFITNFAKYDIKKLDNMGYFNLLKYKYSYTLKYPTDINYLIEFIYIYNNNHNIFNLIEKLIILNPTKLDIFNKDNYTPLYVACKKNIYELIKLIIKYKINYDITYEYINDFTNLIKYVPKKLLKFVNLNKIKIDYSYQDIYRSSYGHIIFNKPDLYPKKFKIMILKYSNLSNLNSYRQSILHLLFRNDNFIKYINILKYRAKKDNLIIHTLFIKDNFDNSPIDYLKSDIKKKFLYDKFINKLGFVESYNNDLNKYYLPQINNSSNLYIFNNFRTVSLFYNILMLLKYPNLGLYYSDKKINNFNIDLSSLKLHINYLQYIDLKSKIKYMINNNHLSIYNTFIWYDKNMYYIQDDIFNNFDKLYKTKNMTYFYILITIILDTNELTHVNILFFDYNNKYVIRFESHGLIYQNSPRIQQLDIMLENYIKKNKSDFKYIKPSDYLVNISFQLSAEEQMIHTIGTPTGYCLAWTYWFMETMLALKSNQVNSIKKINKIMKVLLMKLLYETNPALYIKAYANNIDTQLIEFFNKYKIPTYFAYKICYDEDVIDTNCNKLIKFGVNFLKKLI